MSPIIHLFIAVPLGILLYIVWLIPFGIAAVIYDGKTELKYRLQSWFGILVLLAVGSIPAYTFYYGAKIDSTSTAKLGFIVSCLMGLAGAVGFISFVAFLPLKWLSTVVLGVFRSDKSDISKDFDSRLTWLGGAALLASATLLVIELLLVEQPFHFAIISSVLLLLIGPILLWKLMGL
jgi:hypothetical protein